MQCKHIPDGLVIDAVEFCMDARNFPFATRWEVAACFPSWPFKLVSAKLNRLVRKGKLAGDPDGHDTRGEFHPFGTSLWFGE